MLTELELALRGEVEQLVRDVGEIRVHAARMRQDFDDRMNDVHHKCDGLQVRLDVTAWQLLNARNSFRMVRKRLEQHSGRLFTRCVVLELFLSSLVSRFVDRVSDFISDVVAAHRVRLTSVVASASDSWKLGSWSIVKLFCAAKGGDTVPASSPEATGISPSTPLVPENN